MMAYYETVQRILIIIFVINIATALAKGSYGILTGSLSMSADGLHSLLDATSIQLVLVAVNRLQGQTFPQITELSFAVMGITLLICGLILLTGLEIVRDGSKALLDKALVEESRIIDLAESVEGVCSCHSVRTRGTSGEIFVDMHIGDVIKQLEMNEDAKYHNHSFAGGNRRGQNLCL